MSVIFWDFDGTLVHSEHLWSSSVWESLLRTDPRTHVTFEQIRECNKSGFTWQTPDDDHTAHINEQWWDHMNRHFYNSYRSCGVKDNTAKAATMNIRHMIKQPERYRLFDDTLSTLSAVQKAGHQNVLLSNNYPDLSEVLDALRLSPLLNGVVLSAVEGFEKPRSELFCIAKARYPSQSYYMIGDNVVADIIGGNSAGMTTVFVHNGFCEHAAYSFDSLAEILQILNQSSDP